ncbi:protein Aatf [Anopheles aquasalis]|uniref:protein Aatf n=1 Tax=Anopheles aquasalis TaxID=42839 RepID=UPI00215A4178|nr:protein Aatf [Anopheles aquasalis]
MKKKPVTLSDKINKLFDPDAGPEYSDDSGSDEAAPKFSEFDELPETTGGTGLSEIRKRNVQLLEDIDQKYGGAVSSRKEAFGEDEDYFRDEDDGDEDDDGEEEDEEDDFGEDDDEDEEEEEQPTVKQGSILRLKPPQSDDDDSGEGDSDENGSDEASDNESDEQDESFATYLQQSQAQPAPKTKLLTEENRQETIGKGLAVQNQLKLWERMLEMRIKLQPCVIAANSLPPVDSYDRFSRENNEFREKASETTKTITDALDNLLKLQEMLFDQFSETKQLLKTGSKRKALQSRLHSGGKRSAVEEYEKCLAGRAHDTVDYRNGVLMKWHDRTKIASSVRNQKQSLSVLKKIEDSLINREELVRKTQLYRGGYQRLGRPTSDCDPSKPSGQTEEKQPTDHPEEDDDQPAEAKPVYDEEIYEDSDFYHQLLRELIEYKTNTTDSPQEIANKLAELQKLRNKMKKNVDTKATKGRKIRYVVHKKLVNFMAPIPDYDWTDDAKDELFGSLFGKIPTTATE